MAYDRLRDARPPVVETEAPEVVDVPAPMTKFTGRPPYPPVSADASSGPSPSDLAFAADRSEHKEELEDGYDPRFLHAPPKPVVNAPPIVNETDRRARAAGFEQLAHGHTRAGTTPADVELPASLDNALDQAWTDSLAAPTEQEEGGNIVRTYGGAYKLRRGHDHTTASFDPDFHDVGTTQSLVGVAHTHPYRDEKAENLMSTDWGTFSGEDIANLVNDPIDVELKVLRSGPYTFMLSRTTEFNALVAKDNLDQAGHSPLYAAIVHTFEAAKHAHEGPMADKLEAGVMAVCKQYHLVYYEGSGRELHRMTGQS